MLVLLRRKNVALRLWNDRHVMLEVALFFILTIPGEVIILADGAPIVLGQMLLLAELMNSMGKVTL